MKEHVSLAPFTTFGVGGEARFFIEANTDADVKEAITCAHEFNLHLYPLGAGSNILVPDEGVEGVVLKMAPGDITFENDGDEILLVAGAGARWESVVDAANERGVFGIENLAGIPGTIGGASVQNIGAYGAELADVFSYADIINSTTGVRERINRAKAVFAYRTSFFKTHRELIILNVALRFSKNASPNLAYPDIARAHTAGTPLGTPREIANVIRAIRAKKFPHVAGEGTAGSFFKNPIIDEEMLARLRTKYPDLPMYPASAGGGSASGGKVSLAWLLDHALSLKGFSKGLVRLYEAQPLVIVARVGATAEDVNAFANEIAERVFKATGIVIEREVEMFGA